MTLAQMLAIGTSSLESQLAVGRIDKAKYAEIYLAFMVQATMSAEESETKKFIALEQLKVQEKEIKQKIAESKARIELAKKTARDNRIIKAMDSNGSMIGGLGAGGMSISTVLFENYFKILKQLEDLSLVSLPTPPSITG